VTNTGPTDINGDLGTDGTSITGFSTGTFTGTEFIAGQVTTPLNDAEVAYTQIAALNGATVLTGSMFQGNMLAGISVTLDTAVVVNGGIFGLGGSVKLDSNVISVQSCPVASTTSSTVAATSTSQSKSLTSSSSRAPTTQSTFTPSATR
jgi:hypothetical protein